MYKLPQELMHSKFRFVTLASKRAEQLQYGSRPKVEASTRKATVTAQKEVALGLVDEWDPEQEKATDLTEEEE